MNSPSLVAITASPEASGAELVLTRYLASLVEQGWDVTVLRPDGDVAELLDPTGVHVCRIPSLKLDGPRRPAQVRSMLRRWSEAGETLARVAADADVVLANSLHALPSVRAAAVRAPVAWLIHDVLRRADLKMVERLASPSVDLAIAVSDAAAARMRTRRVPTVVVRNGTELTDRRVDLYRNDPPIAGIAARLTPWKGQEIALRALPLMERKLRLEIAGGAFSGDIDHVRFLHQLTTELGLDDRVTFLGHVADPIDVMCGWSVALSTSVEPEAGPLTVVEALSVGLPVVATGHGGVVELDTPSVRLVPPGDPVALAAALDRVVADLDIIGGEALVDGPAYAREHFDIDRQHDRFEEALLDLVGRRSSHGLA
ncbi:MAG: glycosyltransferase family 4 protein [Actinomycetota bacterium]